MWIWIFFSAKDELEIFGSNCGKSTNSAVMMCFVQWMNSTHYPILFLQFHRQSVADWKTLRPWFPMHPMWSVWPNWLRSYLIVVYLLQPISHLLNDKRDSSSSWLDSLNFGHKKACSMAGSVFIFSCPLKRVSWFSLVCYVYEIIWNIALTKLLF